MGSKMYLDWPGVLFFAIDRINARNYCEWKTNFYGRFPPYHTKPPTGRILRGCTVFRQEFVLFRMKT